MDVVFALRAPVFEADAELERGLGGGHELLLVDLEQAMECDQRRDRGFTDTDGADFVRLEERDVEHLAECPAQCRRYHPARGASARDDHATHAHRFNLASRRARISRTDSSVSAPTERRAASGMCATVFSSASN